MKLETFKNVVHTDRLLRLADLLEDDALKPDGVRFDLGTWVTPSGSNHYLSKPASIPVDCNTSACAIGLACISGEFAKYGLTYFFRPMDAFSQSSGLLPALEQNGDVFTAFDAVEVLFNIGHNDALYLFDPDYYPLEKRRGSVAELYVAERIREFLQGRIDRAYHPSTQL